MPVATRDLSITEAAARLGVSLGTLYNRMKAGTAPPSYRLSHRRLFPEAELDRWLAEQRAGAK